MEHEWIPHLIRVVGLFLGALGATAVLAADWSTVERYLVKVGRVDPLLYYIPLIGYPFNQAKNLANIFKISKILFKDGDSVSKCNEGFSYVKRLSIQEINESDSNTYPHTTGIVEDFNFTRMELDRSIGRPGSLVEEDAYTKFYDSDNNDCGWIWTSRLRNNLLNQTKDIISKTGASLFIGGFLLQLIAELISIPQYPAIQIPHIIVGVVSLCVVLSIPIVCEQQK